MLRLAGGGDDIVLVQEPWVIGGKVCGLGNKNYKLLVAGNEAVSLELQSASVRLLSVYLAYDSAGPPPDETTRTLVQECEKHSIGLIIGCDANALHTQWGSTGTNPRGPDQISTVQLQKAGNTAINWLHEIFGKILKTGCIPPTWLQSKIAFIPKAGKPSHTSAKDFRPISLSSFLLKTLERLISLHLTASIDPRLMSESQHAYRKGRSTDTAHHSVISIIEKSLLYKEYTLIAFLDIEGAFNNVTPAAITAALLNLGFDTGLMGLISQLLTCRTVTSTLGSSTLSRFVSRGTPQGGVLSPLLWNIAINKLLWDMEGGGCKMVAYADDVAIIFRGKYPQTLCDLMTSKLKILSCWAQESGLGVNPNKTELVLFTRNYKVPSLVPPRLNNVNLLFKDSANFLGLTLDRKLDWNLNTQTRVKKATVALYTCRKSIGLKWGMSPNIVRWLYTSITRPILLYGVAVWWPYLKKKTTLSKLNKVQRMAELCISGALRTTPSEALDAILDIPCLERQGMENATLTAIRLRESLAWTTQSTGHASILEGKPTIPSKTDYCVPVTQLGTPFNTYFPQREEWVHGTPGPPATITFFTDGSKLDNRVGGGVYSEQLNLQLSFSLPTHCSVFQAEVLAIKEALDCLDRLKVSPGYINIYIDSQAAIKSISSISSNSISVTSCRKSLHEMAKQHVISLIWVPGHQDIEGNCKADELARKGTILPLLTDKEGISMPLATCKHNIREEHRRRSCEKWQNATCARIAHQTWPIIDSKRSKELCSLSRTNCSAVIRALTGHWLVGIHANRLQVPQNDFCRSCKEEEEVESPEHFFCLCPALARKRLEILGNYSLKSLSELRYMRLAKIAKFINASGWANI
ncbi:uncharacterized protein LOC122322860 [Drosophila grimshawi]|uniref:uncharacterized protein LOC122322860 n=1 Tax=Drosophila grimshawi TaxID=7222 RepID=UPI001C931F17|nr:uncharacterized protein LOC122322860 [Drosophila grimshawi]